MAVRKKYGASGHSALGRGLDALISTSEDAGIVNDMRGANITD